VNLVIPEPSLVVLIGASGSGKSTFAKKHFQPTEIVSSDHCRALISDDENDQSVTPEAFELLHLIVSRRLRKRRLTVVDATNVQTRSRRTLLDLARRYAIPAVAVVFDLAESTCLANNRRRLQRVVPAQVIATQSQELRTSLPQLGEEGFAAIYVLRDSNEVDQTAIIRQAPTLYRSDDFRATEDRRPNWLRKLLRTLRSR
jgi:protein phosphatase